MKTKKRQETDERRASIEEFKGLLQRLMDSRQSTDGTFEDASQAYFDMLQRDRTVLTAEVDPRDAAVLMYRIDVFKNLLAARQGYLRSMMNASKAEGN